MSHTDSENDSCSVYLLLFLSFISYSLLHPSIYCPIYLHNCISIYLSIYCSIHLFICISIYLSIVPSIHLFIYLAIFYQSIHPNHHSVQSSHGYSPIQMHHLLNYHREYIVISILLCIILLYQSID
jgi:hypothetical protein